MSVKLVVTLQRRDEAGMVRDSGMEVLAEYPDSLLVLGTDEQARRLTELGIEAAPLPEQQVQVTGASFAFEDAVRAQDSVAVEPRLGRTAYYLVKLAGPAAPEWLQVLRGDGAEVYGSLPGFTLLAGMLSLRVAAVRAEPWVEYVTPDRPTMKVSPKLRRGVRRELNAGTLAAVAAEEIEDQQPQLVEVSVFPGESVNDVAARVRDAGGTVLTTLGRSLVANVRPSAIAELADVQGIQAILPHALPELHNDQATLVMQVPPDHAFADLKLTGTGQIVGIADTGLDTGDPATVHVDVRGRVAGLTSWPTLAVLAPYTNDPPGHDDGPADPDSAHGTHVAGSVPERPMQHLARDRGQILVEGGGLVGVQLDPLAAVLSADRQATVRALNVPTVSPVLDLRVTGRGLPDSCRVRIGDIPAGARRDGRCFEAAVAEVYCGGA
jgi:hypothetical protein